MIKHFNYDGVCNVQLNFDTYQRFLTNKVLSILKFSNLPDTVDERFLKETLILDGQVCFTQFNGTDIYALNGSQGGEPNSYYEPQNFIIANPILGSKQVKIRHKDGRKDVNGLEGILVTLTPFDETLPKGLSPLIYKYAGLLADNDVSLNCAQINGRIAVAYSADSEAEANTAEEVLKDIYSGKPYRVLTQNILEKVQATPIAISGTTNTVMGLIEAHRSLLQDFFNEIGIGYQGNAKRERVNTAEIGLMRGCLDISVWTIIDNVKKGIERVNQLFGTSIEVELNEEIFYEGSGNATLGIEEEETEAEEVKEEEIDEKNTEEIIEEEEKRGKENSEVNEE